MQVWFRIKTSTDCNVLPCHRHCSLLAGCHWYTTLQKVQLTAVFSKSVAAFKIPRDVYHTLRMREIFSAIFISLFKLLGNRNNMPQCATTFPTIPLNTPLTHLPKLLQPLEGLTVVLRVLTIVYLNVLGQKRWKSMPSSFNIQYKTSRSDNILVLAQCKCVKIRLANVREVIWFSNDRVT